MRKLFQILILLFIVAGAHAQDDHSGTVLKDFMTRQQLTADATFGWQKSAVDYTPNASAVTALQAAKDSIYILAFGGTWCGDTKFILPKFFRLADAAGLPADHITLVGVDHDKKTIQNLSQIFNIVNVPTFIVLKNGQELGRVVEYGKHGMWDKEIGQIAAGEGN